MTGASIKIREHVVNVISAKDESGVYEYFLEIDGHRFLISQALMKSKEDSVLKELLHKSIDLVEQHGVLVKGVL